MENFNFVADGRTHTVTPSAPDVRAKQLDFKKQLLESKSLFVCPFYWSSLLSSVCLYLLRARGRIYSRLREVRIIEQDRLLQYVQ